MGRGCFFSETSESEGYFSFFFSPAPGALLDNHRYVWIFFGGRTPPTFITNMSMKPHLDMSAERLVTSFALPIPIHCYRSRRSFPLSADSCSMVSALLVDISFRPSCGSIASEI